MRLHSTPFLFTRVRPGVGQGRAGSAEFLSDASSPRLGDVTASFLVASWVPIEMCSIILLRLKHFLLRQSGFGGQDGGQVRGTRPENGQTVREVDSGQDQGPSTKQ